VAQRQQQQQQQQQQQSPSPVAQRTTAVRVAARLAAKHSPRRDSNSSLPGAGHVLQWESPELFGLHSNADMISLRTEQSEIFECASSLLSRSFAEQASSKGQHSSNHGGGPSASDDDEEDGAGPGSDDDDSEAKGRDSDKDVSGGGGGGEGSRGEGKRGVSVSLLSPGDTVLSHAELELLKAAVGRMKMRLPAQLTPPDASSPSVQRLLGQPEQAPYVSVVLQECDRMNRLLRTMGATLGRLRLALGGQHAMSDELHATARNILANRVPRAFQVGGAEGRSEDSGSGGSDGGGGGIVTIHRCHHCFHRWS
jgi:hypothetical protein